MPTLAIEHDLKLHNHKYQLFAYLKMLGVPLGTRDLYAWRGR
jgi:hypothetical protein